MMDEELTKIWQSSPNQDRVKFEKSRLMIEIQLHPMKTFITPDGATVGENDALATFVFVKKNGVWLVKAVENVVLDEKAQAFNPITMRNNQNKEK